MSSDLTPGDFGNTLTGFDEIAIAQRFGRTITEMTMAADFSMSTRALIFVAKRREGATDDEAWNGAMELPMGEVHSFFADATDDEAEDAGKDSEAPVRQELEPEQRPESLLSSAS